MSDIVHVIRATVNPTTAPTREGQHWVNTTTNVTWISVGISTTADWISVGDSDQVKVSGTDSTPAFLNSKVTAGTGIAINILNPGANEIIEISAPGSTTDEKVKVSSADTTAGYLDTELTISNGVNLTNPLEKSITSPGFDEKLNITFDQTKISIISSQVSDFIEAAQDAVLSSIVDSTSIDFTYNDLGNNLTAVVLPAGVDHNSLQNFVAAEHVDHTIVSLIAGTGISTSGLGDLTASRTITIADTAVSAASYGSSTQVATFTVNAQGQLTSATDVSIAISSSAITDFIEAAQDAIAGALTDTTSIDFTYNDFGNTITADVLPAGVDKNSLGGSALSIGNGGTGQTTAADAFNALSPLTTTGDIIYESAASISARLPIGTSGEVLKVVAGIPAWAVHNSFPIPTTSGEALIYDMLGANNGVAPLGASGKIDVGYLPADVFIYKGIWDPTSNTPVLIDGVGVAGYAYWVDADFAGPVVGLSNASMANFQIGDLVIYNGTQYELTTPSAGVKSVNGAQGTVIVNAINQLTGDVTTSAASQSQSLGATVTFVGTSSAADVHSAELLANAATDLNTAFTIVKRAASGNFSAGTITANLTGNVSGSAASFTDSLAGEVTGTQSATTIAANVVTNTKLTQMPANSIKGNNTGATANALDLTATQTTAMLNTLVGDSGSGGIKGLVPAPAAGDAAASKFLKADGTWATAGGDAVNQSDRYYVDGNLGNDSTGDGSISKPFLTIQKSLDVLGQPTTHIDAMRTIHIYVSGKLSAIAGGTPQTFDGCYSENLTVPSRRITIFGYGVKLGDNGNGTGGGNILKEYSSSRRFGATSSELRPCLTLVGLANARDSHQRLRNGFHVGGTCRTAILKRNLDSIQGNGTNTVTIHITSGQFAYPITISAFPTEAYIRIAVSGTTNYNATYDITSQINATTFVATRISGTNAAVALETSGSFFESDSAGASGITHDSTFINTYMQGHYTCDDGTVNSAAPTAGTEVLFSIGTRYFTGITGRTILAQRWEDTTLNSTAITAGAFIVGTIYTIAAIGSTDFTLIGAASNTIGVVFTATGVGTGTGTATINTLLSSIAGMDNCSFAGPLTLSTFTYSADDMGFMSCRFNAALLFTVTSAGQTVRMDDATLTSFLRTGSTWVTNTPIIEAPSIQMINAQVGTTYSPILSDTLKLITCSNASPITVTINPDSTVNFPIGCRIDFIQKGVGKVTFAQGAGVTINSKGANKSINGTYVAVSIIKETANTWYLIGDLTA